MHILKLKDSVHKLFSLFLNLLFYCLPPPNRRVSSLTLFALRHSHTLSRSPASHSLPSFTVSLSVQPFSIPWLSLFCVWLYLHPSLSSDGWFRVRASDFSWTENNWLLPLSLFLTHLLYLHTNTHTHTDRLALGWSCLWSSQLSEWLTGSRHPAALDINRTQTESERHTVSANQHFLCSVFLGAEFLSSSVCKVILQSHPTLLSIRNCKSGFACHNICCYWCHMAFRRTPITQDTRHARRPNDVFDFSLPPRRLCFQPCDLVSLSAGLCKITMECISTKHGWGRVLTKKRPHLLLVLVWINEISGRRHSSSSCISYRQSLPDVKSL